MNITFDERPNSYRTTTNPKSDTVGYCLTGAATMAIARAYSAGVTPMIRAGMWRQNIDARENGFQTWDIDVTWGPYSKKEAEAGDYKWSFDTTGGTKHITQGIAHIADYVLSGKTAADHKGAIGVNENGEVEGIDVPDKSFKWTESRQLLLGSHAWDYAQIVDSITGMVNNASFRGLDAHTVLFEGAQGGFSIKDPLMLDLTFHFSRQHSVASTTIGDITGVYKLGWYYLWVEYQSVNGGAANRLAKKPCQVNVDQVFYEGDFSQLGIGTGALILPTGF